MGDFWTTFFYIVVMVAILVTAYLATRYLAGKGRSTKSRQMRVLDRMMLGKDKHIVLLEVGDKNLLIGVTNQAINVLGDIDGETLKSQPSENAAPAQQGGFGAKMRDFLIRMKDAPANYQKARTDAKTTQWPREEDYLSRMDDAIQRRSSRTDGGREDE